MGNETHPAHELEVGFPQQPVHVETLLHDLRHRLNNDVYLLKQLHDALLTDALIDEPQAIYMRIHLMKVFEACYDASNAIQQLESWQREVNRSYAEIKESANDDKPTR